MREIYSDIFSEFINSMDCISNNYYFSFLSVNFFNRRPFEHDIILAADLSKKTITAESINSLDKDLIHEYGNSIRRHVLNDIVIAYERYSTRMYASYKSKTFIEPAVLKKKYHPKQFESELLKSNFDDEVKFLIQLRHLRNCIVHYNGKYSYGNELDYTFGNECYKSTDKLGQDISISFDTIEWIIMDLRKKVNICNEYYLNNKI